MFCQKCGSQIENGDAFCQVCGTRVGVPVQQPMPGPYYPQQQESNGLAIAGFVLSFFFPLVGLILSIVGYSKAKYLNNSGKGLALAGIIISSIAIVTAIIVIIILVVAATPSTRSSYYYYR